MDLRRFLSVLLASRLWLLLALAPYLFLSAAGDSFHNHPLFENVSTQGHSAFSHQGQNDTTYPAGDCIACWWLSHSQVQTVSLPPRLFTVCLTDCVYCSQAISLPVSWRIVPATRGPPLV